MAHTYLLVLFLGVMILSTASLADYHKPPVGEEPPPEKRPPPYGHYPGPSLVDNAKDSHKFPNGVKFPKENAELHGKFERMKPGYPD